MSKKEQGIKIIKYGELHVFYPMRFEKKVPIKELRDKIQESSIVFKDEYTQEVLEQLGNDMCRLTEEWNQKYGDVMQIRVVDYENALHQDKTLSDIRKEDLRIEMFEENGKLYTSLVSAELEALQERTNQMVEEYDQSIELYGRIFTDVQNRFLLLPLKVTLYNGKKVWLYPFLYLFSNGMAVLKLELPLVDVETDMLKDNELDKYIQSTVCTWDEGVESFTSLNQIEKFYKDKIYNNKIEFVATNDTFRHIIMTNYVDMPNDMDSLSNAMKEDIFRIICAPAPRIPGSILEDAEGLLKNNSWGKHSMRTVLKSTGGCLSFVDIETFEHCSKVKYGKKLKELGIMDRAYLATKLVRDIEVNVEFAILIIIMKKLNQRLSLWQKQNNDKDYVQVQKDYYENVIFIDSLQEACYGSVSEQVFNFEKMLPHYMKSELMAEKLNAVESILEIEKNEKEEKIQKFVTVGGLLLNVIFGLPSIYGALGILRDFCSFIQGDMPIISKTNASVIIWLLLNAWISWKVFVNRKNS